MQTDVVNLPRKLIPQGVWLHDAQDGNGDAPLKAGLVGPSETTSLIDEALDLSRWQNIFSLRVSRTEIGPAGGLHCYQEPGLRVGRRT